MSMIDEILKETPDTKACRLGPGVTEQVAELFKELFPVAKKALVVDDVNTKRVAGDRVIALLKAAGIDVSEYTINPDGSWCHATYDKVSEVRDAISSALAAVPVAVGSGTINDLVNRASEELGLRYMVVGTAASMDGYTSFGAAITKDGMKQTLACKAPLGCIVDSAVAAAAPREMTAAGYADLLAKIPAGADWMLADAIGSEAIHPAAWSFVQDALREALANPVSCAAGDEREVRKLCEGLVMSGFAMQAMQSSRPASGAEHMFSHILDMTHHTCRGELVSHGAQVGVYTLFMVRFHEELLKFDMAALDVEKCVADWVEWGKGGEALARAPFAGTKFPNLGVEQSKPKWQTKEELRATLTAAKARWPEIAARLRAQLVPSAEIERRLKAVGSPACPAEIGVANDFVERNILFAMFMRNRYNALDFAFRLGKLFDFAKAVVAPWN